MQNRPASSRAGLWQRLPVIGRLLIAFWAVLLAGGVGAAAFLFHQQKPVILAKITPPAQPEAPPAQNTSSIVSTPVPKEAARPVSPSEVQQPAMPAAAPTVIPAKAVPPTLATPSTAVTQQPLPSPAAASPAAVVRPPSPAVPADKTAIAIVLQGFGYSDALTYDVLSRIPAPVAVGISPYVSNIGDIIARAHASHREVYVTLPMQSAHPERVDEGPHALGYGNSAADDQRELEWCLSRATGADGLTDASENGDDQPGGGYATSPDFAPIASIISSKGLLYLAGSAQDSRRTRGMTATAWIDGDTDAATLDSRLAALLPQDGKPTKILLMVGPVTPVMIDRLANWLKGPAAGRFVLVPPSSFVDSGIGNDQAANLLSSSPVAPL
ncbi:divergent polysaccharide deacetylase family protein [Gluconobacter kondonii]|uniref:divergent polysaccharide deacetylase family protein n=1 Tax=Gluconobacter kondonii TaxID=941463 RepID=UPI001B8C2D2F|nr:divergent polysaccharide deacetylase family protein [Gluconobacter kondonii]